MGAAAPPPPKPGLFQTFSAGGGAAAAAAGMRRNSTLKAQLSRVSCGLGSDSGGSAYMDGSIHAANMVYRMTGTTGSLAYMAPEVRPPTRSTPVMHILPMRQVIIIHHS